MGLYTAFLDEIGLDDLRQVGGKAANLGHLTAAGYRVPPGFSVKADAFDAFLGTAGLSGALERSIASLDFDDLASVDRVMAEGRALMEATPLPEPVASEIRGAYAALMKENPGALLAVRSSVGTRDLSASSFPGQMDTYHNLAGEDEVLEMVRRCWASCFSYSATVSRNARGIGQFDVFVAPIVQLMVPSQTAGVVFSANPMNGRLDQIVINACYGLGEGVVSGEVNADHFVVERGTMSIAESRTGDKKVMFTLDEEAGRGTSMVKLDDERSRRACISEAQVLELARAAVAIEERYGCPQDIEWAYCDGVLHLLQSRRITTLERTQGAAAEASAGEWDSEFDTRIDPRYPYYTLSNISEVLCGVLTPLTISGIDALDYGFVKTNTDFGLMKRIRPDSEYTFLGIFYNRAHLNLSVVKAVTAQLPGASAQEFERMLPEGASEFDEKFRLTPRSALTMAGAMFRILYKVARTPRDVAAMREELTARIERARALNFEVMPYPEILRWMDDSREYRFRVIAQHITVSQFAVVFYDFLRELTGKWLGDESGTVAARLVTGLQNIESAQPSVEIWDLSRRVVSSEALSCLFADNAPPTILDALRSSRTDESDAFLRELDEFLGRFGYRGVFEAELMLPNWGEDPSYVFEMIKNYLRGAGGTSPRELAARQEREREETSRKVFERLSGPRRFAFRGLLAQAQKFIAMREFTKATLIMGIAQIKREYHALSRRYTREGLIPSPSDLFFLTGDEVQALAAGERGLDVGALVERRRREYELNKTVVLPEYSRGKPRPLRGDELGAQEGVEVLEGIAVSPGRVTGKARVITDPRSNAAIEPGEILIAPVTDAAWTPLFVTAAAIVVDVGGPLSHGSIVAREYGIPGVLNVGAATRMISTGQLITVDGDAGKVYLHGAEHRAETRPDEAAQQGESMGSITPPAFTTGQKVKAMALRALYGAYRKAKGAGRPLAVEAEYPHASGDDREWNESLYFNFTDARTGMGGYTRIGILPNQQSDIGVMMLFAGGKRLLVTDQGGRGSTSGGFEVGALRYERLEPLWKWRLSFSGEMGDLADSRDLPGVDPETVPRVPVEVDLTWEGIAPPFNFKDAEPAAVAEMLVSAGTKLGDLRAVSRVGSEHYEQAGRVTGVMKIDGVEHPVEGRGHRDHSWGVRDWSAPRAWTWLTSQFGDELAFNLSRVAIKSVDIFNGFVCRDGKNYPVRRAELRTEFEEDGTTQKSLAFSLEDTSGKVIEVAGRVLTVIPLDLRSRGHATMVNEALAEYEWEGRKAYGIAEYLHQM